MKRCKLCNKEKENKDLFPVEVTFESGVDKETYHICKSCVNHLFARYWGLEGGGI